MLVRVQVVNKTCDVRIEMKFYLRLIRWGGNVIYDIFNNFSVGVEREHSQIISKLKSNFKPIKFASELPK